MLLDHRAEQTGAAKDGVDGSTAARPLDDCTRSLVLANAQNDGDDASVDDNLRVPATVVTRTAVSSVDLETESLATDAQHVRPGDDVQARGEAIVFGGGLPDESDHCGAAKATAFGTGREGTTSSDYMSHDSIEVRHVKPEQTGSEFDMRQVL